MDGLVDGWMKGWNGLRETLDKETSISGHLLFTSWSTEKSGHKTTTGNSRDDGWTGGLTSCLCGIWSKGCLQSFYYFAHCTNIYKQWFRRKKALLLSLNWTKESLHLHSFSLNALFRTMGLLPENALLVYLNILNRVCQI